MSSLDPALDYWFEPLLWIAVSLLLYALGSNMAWLARKLRVRPIRRLLRWWRDQRLRPLVHGALRLFYYLGVPYVALLRGVIGPRSVGLLPVAWEDAARWAVGIGGGALLLWGMIWWGYARALPPRPMVTIPQSLLERAQTRASLWGWPLLLLDVLLLEAHWAFYRAGPLLLLGDWYSGVALGTVLVLLESYSHPAIRHGLRRPDQADDILLAAALIVVMAVVFLYTRSFWICLAVHFWLEIALLAMERVLMQLKT